MWVTRGFSPFGLDLVKMMEIRYQKHEAENEKNSIETSSKAVNEKRRELGLLTHESTFLFGLVFSLGSSCFWVQSFVV